MVYLIRKSVQKLLNILSNLHISTNNPTDIRSAADQFRLTLANDQQFYKFVIKSLKSTLYGFYGPMLPPLLAVGQGGFNIPIEKFAEYYENLSQVPRTPDSNYLKDAAICLSTHIQGQLKLHFGGKRYSR